MQNLERSGKFQTIYLQKRALKAIVKHSQKKLLRHYLVSIEAMTREGFFKRSAFRIAPSEYPLINKNAFPTLHQAHTELETLKIEKGPHNTNLCRFSESYPKSMKDWNGVEGGFLKIDREELLKITAELEDNELRVYFVLKMIFDCNKSPEMGLETWPKVIRESHMAISQTTLKKCLGSLEEKGLISLAYPIEKTKRFLNRFIFLVKKISKNSESKKLGSSFQENKGETTQFPEKCLHLNKAVEFKKGFNLNQGTKKTTNCDKQKQKSDFNFYGLDKIERPLSLKTIYLIKEESGLEISEIQESVKRLSEFWFSHRDIQKEYKNPVGFLRHHMRQFKEIFIQPEWWFHQKGKIHLGEDRFSSSREKREELQLEDRKRLSAEEVSDFLGKFLEGVAL